MAYRPCFHMQLHHLEVLYNTCNSQDTSKDTLNMLELASYVNSKGLQGRKGTCMVAIPFTCMNFDHMNLTSCCHPYLASLITFFLFRFLTDVQPQNSYKLLCHVMSLLLIKFLALANGCLMIASINLQVVSGNVIEYMHSHLSLSLGSI